MSNALLLAITQWDPAGWLARFRAEAPDRDIRLWPDGFGDPAGITYACAWKPPAGLLRTLPNLKAIFSLGAGVDGLLLDPTLPDVPVVRIVDPDLTGRMVEYVTLHVLMAQRFQRLYDAQQAARVWKEHRAQPPAREVTVGIMGMGVMGRACADVLVRLGFNVAGWSRRGEAVAGVEMFAGEAGIGPFLARTEILVVLLPHTPATDGILNLGLFRQLRRDGALGGAHVINAGRGKLQVEADILAALDEGTLASATLDVFATEPLPADNPLWAHPKVTITPHNSAVSSPDALVRNILGQIERFEAGGALANVVDRRAGY